MMSLSVAKASLVSAKASVRVSAGVHDIMWLMIWGGRGGGERGVDELRAAQRWAAARKAARPRAESSVRMAALLAAPAPS